jgi:hypothetical protein
MEDRIDKLRPDILLKTFESLDNNDLKRKLMNGVVKTMRDNKYDIRKFRLN